MVYLTEETFTYVINGNDRDFENSVLDDSVDVNLRSIILSEDFGINMGSHLDSSVEEFYCEVVLYSYNNNIDDNTSPLTNVYFTQMLSDLPKNGKAVNIAQLDKARYPLTEFSSTKNNTLNNDNFCGISRNNIHQLQKNTFVCENFNTKMKYFRIASLKYNSTYGFDNIKSYALPSYADSSLMVPYSANLTDDGALNPGENNYTRRLFLKNYPTVIMYMTPIYKDRIPRILKYDDSIILQISSLERNEGYDGVSCTIPITPINSKYKKFKAVFSNLSLYGSLAISQFNRSRCAFNMHLLCYDWDKSAYGYGGDKNNGFIITTNPITFHYEKLTGAGITPSKLESKYGSIMTIDNELNNINIKFKWVMSQMQEPLHDPVFNLATTFLSSIAAPIKFEWILTMKLYGIE